MAFQNIVFPELKLIHGMSRTRSDRTVVFGNGYNEFRIRRGNIDPLDWSFPGRNMLAADAKTLIDFYNTVNGTLDSFKFKDPSDYKWTLFELEHHSGTAWTLKSNSGSYIYLLNGAINIFLNTVGIGSTSTVTVINGKPTINVPGSISTDTVQVTGQFYYGARFNSTLSYEVAALDNSNDVVAAVLGTVNLHEVSEYA